MNADIDRAADFLAALANPRRLMILDLLTQGELSVGELVMKVDLSQSALSQHLAKLRAASLVSTRRHGQTVYYCCRVEAVSALLNLVLPLYPQMKSAKQTTQNSEKPIRSPE